MPSIRCGIPALLLTASFLVWELGPPSPPVQARPFSEAGQEAAPPAAGALDPANTYAVIVGVLKWEDQSLQPYSPEKRKDRELHETLRKRGVPAENMTLLLDDQATLANMRQALATITRRTRPESTFIFYYAGHGWRSSKRGTEFANYDYHSGQADRPGFAVSEITDALKQHFKGRRVLLFADCCYSGGLQEVAQALAQAKFQSAALTSVDARHCSTGNWTFTKTLVAGLAGEPILDADGDGAITLAELAREVALAMQYRERQRYGYAVEGLAPDFRLALVDRAKKLPWPIPGGFAFKEFVTTREGAKQRAGRIVGFRNDKYVVEVFAYSDNEQLLLPAAALSKITFKTHKLGETVTLARPGLPKAKVLEVTGGFHRIAFVGLPRRPEEWVLPDSIVADPRSAAEVEWHGQWYPATVLKKEGDRHFIHYADHDESWDEWVTKERIRFPGTARNPFGVVDVPDPKNLKEFAAQVKLLGEAKDKNAQKWVKKETAGKTGELEGEWRGRWEGGSGTAQIKVVNDRVYILYTEPEDENPDSIWLLEAVREGKDRLVGGWVHVENPQETGPFVARIVDDERIDGAWGLEARWDFRRKLKR